MTSSLAWTVVAAVLASAADAKRTPAADTPWYDVMDVTESVYGHKKEIDLPEETALRIFRREFPHLQLEERWRDEIGQPIEPVPGSKSTPPGTLVEQPGHQRASALLVGFSAREIAVWIVRRRGYWMVYRYSECLAAFRIPRTPRIDALFDVQALEQRHAARYEGVGYGDTLAAVRAAFGEPDAIENYQPMGFFRFSYFEADLVIQFQNRVVRSITRGVPPELKDEVKREGRHITRY